MNNPLRWGILGTGNIAGQFAAGVKSARRSVIVAAGSRTLATAQHFAAQAHIPRAYGSYDALLADPDLDVVYNSLPNSLHHEWTIKALRAGKHVLCEKPFAMDQRQAVEMFDAARASKRLLVEAFMYRSHPLMHAVLDTLRSGAIGELRLIRTSFCYRTMRISGNVRFAPDLGGGALMDVGCYCIDFSRLIAGADPTSVHATARKHATGVDDVVAGSMCFPGGVLASFACGMSVQADNTAYVCGTEGYIEIPVPWKPPVSGALYTIARGTPPRQDKPAPAKVPPRETRTVDAGMELYGLEADDFAAAVAGDKPPAVSEPDTLGNMAVLDQIRRQIEPQMNADRRR
ncbi:MAG TPA: Gfo/Idh/MocA family oxidoreductase [Tepidisphaeraceae bacterium]|nr:Gfo/Idh/MocA family oxidoreductase [Tepidisphaeraceae bacterium]